MKSVLKWPSTLTDLHWLLTIFLGTFVLLAFQASIHPVLEGDALEIVAGVHTHGVIHSPGFPVYMLLVLIFSKILFFVSDAFSTSLFSVICASGSSALMFWLLRKKQVSQKISFVFALLPLFFLEVWYQSLIAEVYSFAVLWMLLIVQALMVVSERANLSWSSWLIFLLVAGFGVHLYVWPLIPIGIAALLWWWKKGHWRPEFKSVLIGLFMGLVPFLQIPIMAGNSVYINEGNVDSWQRFVDHVTWKLHRERLSEYEQKRQSNMGDWLKVKAKQFWYFAKAIKRQIELPLVALLSLLVLVIFIPLPISALKRGPPTLTHHLTFLFSVGLFVNIWVLFAGSEWSPSVLSEMEVHLVPMYYFICLWFALGLNLFKSTQLKNGVCLLVSILMSYHVIASYQSLDISDNDLAIVHGHELLNDLPQGSILFSQGDVDLMSIAYQQAVLDFRTDIQMVNLVNGTPWYFDQVKRVHVKGIEWPSFYSKYFQLEVIEKNYGKVPIYFSNYYAALLVLQQSSMKDRFIVVPEKGGYRLTDEKKMMTQKIDDKFIHFSNFVPEKNRKFQLRDVEKDLSGHYKDYYSRRAELLSVFHQTEQAAKEWNQGFQQPIFDSYFNELIHEQLLKVQKRFNIRN